MSKHYVKDKYMTNNSVGTILSGLMTRYIQRVPMVKHIIKSMIRKGMISSQDDIVNDHIAFRTMGVPHLGIRSIEKIFLHYGYIRQDEYHFKQKKVKAYWYAPPTYDANLPRIFISELIVPELSKTSQDIIRKYTNEALDCPKLSLDPNDVKATDEFLHSPLWSMPDITDYRTLRDESEYASWVIHNRYYLNHFTISVHSLPAPYNRLEAFNNFLESIGVTLNDSGGKIKTSEDGYLRQSASVAEQVTVKFPAGESYEHIDIAGSFVEFAERNVMPSGQRRDGFEASNADKIFESTFVEQTIKQ